MKRKCVKRQKKITYFWSPVPFSDWASKGKPLSDRSNRCRPGTCFNFMHLGLTVAKPSDVGIKAILNELLLEELDGLEVFNASCDAEELAADVEGVDWVEASSASLDRLGRLGSKGTNSRAKKKKKEKHKK